MRCIVVAALAASLTFGCSPVPHWNLDTGVIPFSTPLVAHYLIHGLQRLEARTDAGRLLVADAQQAYCVRTATSETPAITTEWNIHVCDSWWQLTPERQRLVIWHELGHVLGAVHSSNPEKPQAAARTSALSTAPPPPPPPVVGSGLSADTGTLPRKIVTGCEPGS